MHFLFISKWIIGAFATWSKCTWWMFCAIMQSANMVNILYTVNVNIIYCCFYSVSFFSLWGNNNIPFFQNNYPLHIFLCCFYHSISLQNLWPISVGTEYFLRLQSQNFPSDDLECDFILLSIFSPRNMLKLLILENSMKSTIFNSTESLIINWKLSFNILFSVPHQIASSKWTSNSVHAQMIFKSMFEEQLAYS